MWRKGRQSWEKFKQGHCLSHRDTQLFPVHPLLASPSEADLHSPHLQTHSIPFGLQLCLIRIPGKSQTSPLQTSPLSRLGKKKYPLFLSCLVAQGELWFSLAETIVMDERNQSAGITFILSGFSEYPQLQVPLFLVFFTVYTVSLVGNLGMIMTIRINPKLHTPVYFFLSYLSFLDFCYSSITTPKLLEILVVDTKTVSYMGCMM